MKIYIAAPFFTQEQLTMVSRIEKLLELYVVDYFSPRSEGVIKEMTKEEREIYMRGIYDSNIGNMEDCDVMLAVIDDYDTGTVFELGYFTCLKNHGIAGLAKLDRKVITITGNDFNLNVMLKFGTDCHLRGLKNLEHMLQDRLQTAHGIDEVLLRHDNSPEVKE